MGRRSGFGNKIFQSSIFTDLFMISKEAYQRYSRHLNLPDFDVETQERLMNARVLVIGAGGLGTPLLQYLVAAGVGHIGIMDPDVVELSNLQRQVLYSEGDLGTSKVDCIAKKLRAQNSMINITTYKEKIDNSNALKIIRDYDLVADGSDNFPTRYLVNDACVICGKPNVYASIFRYEGQVSVFNFTYPDGSKGPNYRDLYPQPPEPGLVPDCASGGVLGVLAGIIGSMQALEVIKLITGTGSPLVGKLLIYDALSNESCIIGLPEKSRVVVDELINYQHFCGVNGSDNLNIMKEISVTELKQWRDQGKDFQLIDVREQNEIEFVNIGGDHIPLGDIMDNKEKISEEKDVVFLCRSGQRSGVAVSTLGQQGYDNLYNLKGGINAWAKEIDNSLPTY